MPFPHQATIDEMMGVKAVAPVVREAPAKEAEPAPATEALADGWREYLDEASGRKYYVNAAGESSWSRP